MLAAFAGWLCVAGSLGGCLTDEAKAPSPAQAVRATGPLAVRVTVSPGKPGRPANAAVLGNNVQWVDYGDELLERSGAGFSTEMLAKVQDLAPAMLRYPGGSLADLYHWRDGMGEAARRGQNEHFYSHARQKVMMGTQEFLELCDEVSAEPFITVNAATGTPEEAAAWVERVNRQGLTSRRTGKRLPKVAYWEIGNEPYLKDEGQKKLWTTPEEFAAKAGRIIRAMKAVDPAIQVGIPLRSDQLGRIPATPHPGFNEKVLRALDADVDFVSLHNAYAPLAMDRKYTDEQLAAAAMSATGVIRADFEQTRQQLKRILPGKKIRLAVTEYNALYSLGGRDSDAYIATLGGALVVADMVREFAETPDLAFAHFWSLSGNWHFGAISKEGALRPAYHVLRLYREALQGHLIPAEIGAPGQDVPPVGIVPAMNNVSPVSGLATVEGKKTRLVLINKHPDSMANVSVALNGKTAARATMTLLSGKRAFSTTVERSTAALDPPAAGAEGMDWKLSLPAHSMALVEFALP
jgi:alpha-N-arabinofuranosidase